MTVRTTKLWMNEDPTLSTGVAVSARKPNVASDRFEKLVSFADIATTETSLHVSGDGSTPATEVE